MAENITIPPIDYTTRDYESTIQDSIKLIPFFAPEYTNHNSSDPGIVMLSIFSTIADRLHYYIDRNAGEGFITTAITRPSIISLLKLINFELTGKAAATVDLVFTLQTVQVLDLIVPVGTQVQTSSIDGSDPVYFETTEELIIPAGDLSGTVTAREGQTVEEFFDNSTGLAYQKRTLSDIDALKNTINLFIDESGFEEQWSFVESLASANINEKVYEIQKENNDFLTIAFGDNIQGKIPTTDATIRATYVIGGGENGNVGANTITQIVNDIILGGSAVTISVTNPLGATGGEEEMTIEEAKRVGPKSLKSLDRGVTEEDIEALSLRVPGVAKVNATIREPVVSRQIDIYIVPAGGGQPSSLLLQDVVDYLEPRKMLGSTINALPPNYVSIDIEGTIFIYPNFDIDEVKANVLSLIDDDFDIDSDSTNFGIGAYLSDIYALIDNADGVRNVDLTRTSLRSEDTIYYLTWSGDAVIDYILITISTINEVWTIIFLSPTIFSVRGSVSGVQANSGVIGTEYISDNNQVKFLISNVGTPNALGDKATFRTSKLVGNSNLSFNEIRIKGNIDLDFVIADI